MALRRQTRWALALCWLVLAGCTPPGGQKVSPETLARGAKLFALYCSGCHFAGENGLYPQKSLHRMELKANGVESAADIVALMRNPGAGMKRFAPQTLPDADAFAIANYVLATF